MDAPPVEPLPVVIRAANAQDFFDLRVADIICKPRLGGRPQD